MRFHRPEDVPRGAGSGADREGRTGNALIRSASVQSPVGLPRHATVGTGRQQRHEAYSRVGAGYDGEVGRGVEI